MMSDCSVDTAGVLEKWVDQYLAWMNQSGFASSTIYIHERLLGHFKRYAEQRHLCLGQLFTHDTLVDFEGHCGLLYASWTLRALARYLAQKGFIASAIQRPAVSLPDIYEEYLEFYKQCGRVAPATLKTTRRILAALYEYLTAASVALPALGIEHIDAFLDRYNKGLAMATCRHTRSYLRGFLRYLYYNRDIMERDLSKLVVGAVDFAHANPPKFLRPGEIKRLFTGPRTHSPWQLRCLAMAHLAHELGLRPREIGLLTLDDVFFEKKRVRIVHRKNDNPLILPLADTAIKAIAAYLVGARPKAGSRRLFLTLTVPFRPIAAATVSGDITRLVRRVNPQATAYWLRHTYAQTLLSSKASIFEVKEMMGHDSLHATRRYLHIHTGLMRRVLFDETV
jgi:site-specific recombinase XerD